MTGKMKRQELYEIEKKLHGVKLTGKTIAFVIADNKKRLMEAINEMEKTKIDSEGFMDHINEVEKLKLKYSEKDHIGRPKMKREREPNGNLGMFYLIPGSDDPKSEYRKALIELEIKNKNVILDREEKEKKYYEEFLQGESEFELRKIKYSALPNDITTEQMDLIMDILDYDVTETMKKDGKEKK